MRTPITETGLLAAAPEDRGFPYLLFFCVLGSVLAHATTFILFQVVYPQRVTIPQPAPRVSLLTPSSPENVALLRWIQAEDPALVANDNPVAPPGLAAVRYRPSYAAPRTAPLGAPVEAVPGVRFPKAVDRLSTSDGGSVMAGPPVETPSADTLVTFSGNLAGRALAKNPAVKMSYLATAPAEPATFLIGVNQEGEVRYSVVQHSSGDSHLDEVAVAHLREVAFAPAAEALTWGFAVYSWGGDAYVAASTAP